MRQFFFVRSQRASLPRHGFATLHAEPIRNNIHPFEEALALTWNFREQSVQTVETGGFDQTFLIAYPFAALARNGVSLLHNCRSRLPCDTSHVAVSRVHPRVVKTERSAESPNVRCGCRKLRR